MPDDSPICLPLQLPTSPSPNICLSHRVSCLSPHLFPFASITSQHFDLDSSFLTLLKSSFSSIIPFFFLSPATPFARHHCFPSLYSPDHPLFIFPQPLGYLHLSTFCVYLESSSSFVHLFLLPRM